MIEIREARFPDDRDAVVRLLQRYAGGIGVDLCFQGFEAELADLPGAYAPPAGRMFLAQLGGLHVGCGAIRRHDAETGEMKRLFVAPEARGHGVGRALAASLLGAARDIGYRRVVLDTLPGMTEAQDLYRRLGFFEISPYYDNPVVGARFLSLNL